MDRENVIEYLSDGILMAWATETMLVHIDADTAEEILAMLKEQKKPNGKCVNECECWDSAYERGKQDALKEQKAVEPVKLVRCKNCKHCDSERIDKNMIWCKIHQFGRPDDYYCADGIEK